MRQVGQDDSPKSVPSLVAASQRRAFAALAGFGAVALWETWASLFPPKISDRDVRAVAERVRSAHTPGELIVVTPLWLSPLFRRELGDLMPAEHLGRADSRRFAKITEIALGARRSEEMDALSVEGEQRLGPFRLRRYEQTPVTVGFDLTDHFLDATVSQSVPGSVADELPCLWLGPLPSPRPEQGAMGGFVCERTRVERRTMEIDYKPRRGIVTELSSGQRTILRFSIPDEAWRGTLHLWLGHHDYHQRKQAVGSAFVIANLDEGQVKQQIRVEINQDFLLHKVPLPTTAMKRDVHYLRLELFAEQAAHHFVGLHAELRQ